MATTGKLPPAETAARTAVTEPVPQIKSEPKPEPKRKAKESAKPERPFRAEMLQQYGGKMKEPPIDPESAPMKKGGSASSRADGCCKRGKTRGRMV